jgi:hypothetical protein
VTERVIHFEVRADGKKPYPVHIREKRVVQGLGADDGAWLIGFAQPGKQELAVMADEGLADPASVAGLVPIFSNAGGFFNWDCPIKGIEEAT